MKSDVQPVSLKGREKLQIPVIFAILINIQCLVINLKKEDRKMKFKVFFAWYDFWVGIYYDRKRHAIYFGFPPTIMWSIASDKNVWDDKAKAWVDAPTKPLYSLNPDCSKCSSNVDCGGVPGVPLK